MKSKVIFTAALVLFGATPSFSAQWMKIAESGEAGSRKTFVEIDVASVKNRDGLVQAWVRYSFDPPNVTQMGKPYGSSVRLQLFDCKNEEFTVLSGTQYEKAYGEGESAPAYNVSRQVAVKEMQAVIPDSVGEVTLKAACRRQ